jgi:hypothetical protein
MKPNPPISKLLKHIKQQENMERILRQQGCPKSAFVRYSVQACSTLWSNRGRTTTDNYRQQPTITDNKQTITDNKQTITDSN